jgi:hypothetical protein
MQPAAAVTDYVGPDVDPGVFTEPRTVTDLSVCEFYHTMDLPGYGTVEGPWDLRGREDEYLGHVPLQGKRVLELGTASGALCFAMEQRGAEVVAFDLAPGCLWDFVPMAGHPNLAEYVRTSMAFFPRMHNSFWLAHGASGSQARVVYGRIYDLPAGIGLVDVATYGCILCHLRDPFLALANGLRLTRETVVITQPLHDRPWERQVMGGPAAEPPTAARTESFLARSVRRLLGRPVVETPPPPPPPMVSCQVFLPMYPSSEVLDGWWFCTPALLQDFLRYLGFEDSRVTYHEQFFYSRLHRLYTIVAHRTQPMPRRIDGPFPWY